MALILRMCPIMRQRGGPFSACPSTCPGTTCMDTTGNAVTLCSLWFKDNVKMLNSLLFFVVVVVLFLFVFLPFKVSSRTRLD